MKFVCLKQYINSILIVDIIQIILFSTTYCYDSSFLLYLVTYSFMSLHASDFCVCIGSQAWNTSIFCKHFDGEQKQYLLHCQYPFLSVKLQVALEQHQQRQLQYQNNLASTPSMFQLTSWILLFNSALFWVIYSIVVMKQDSYLLANPVLYQAYLLPFKF